MKKITRILVGNKFYISIFYFSFVTFRNVSCKIETTEDLRRDVYGDNSRLLKNRSWLREAKVRSHRPKELYSGIKRAAVSITRIASSTFVKCVALALGRSREAFEVAESPGPTAIRRHPTMNSFAPSWNSKQSLRSWHNDNECDDGEEDEEDEEDERGWDGADGAVRARMYSGAPNYLRARHLRSHEGRE